MLAGTGPEHLPVGCDEVHREEVVNGQAVFTHQPAQAATEGQARQPSSANCASGRGEPVDLGCLHELAQRETSPRPGRLLFWIDANAFHAREIDHDAAMADGAPTEA